MSEELSLPFPHSGSWGIPVWFLRARGGGQEGTRVGNGCVTVLHVWSVVTESSCWKTNFKPTKWCLPDWGICPSGPALAGCQGWAVGWEASLWKWLEGGASVLTPVLLHGLYQCISRPLTATYLRGHLWLDLCLESAILLLVLLIFKHWHVSEWGADCWIHDGTQQVSGGAQETAFETSTPGNADAGKLNY